MGTEMTVIMDVVESIEDFFRGISDGTVDPEDLEGLDELWAIAKEQLEGIVAGEVENEMDLEAIMNVLEYLWNRLKAKAIEAVQLQIDDPGRAIMAADIAFAIAMAKSVLYWRLARR